MGSLAIAVLLVVCVLALASLNTASAADCKDLIKPLQDPGKIYGKWVLYVAGWDEPALKADIVSIKGSWIELAPTSDNTLMTIYWADRLSSIQGRSQDGNCLQGGSNITLKGTSYTTSFTIMGQTSYHDGKYYETCPDCLMSASSTIID